MTSASVRPSAFSCVLWCMALRRAEDPVGVWRGFLPSCDLGKVNQCIGGRDSRRGKSTHWILIEASAEVLYELLWNAAA